MMSMSKILNDLLSTNPLMFRSNVVLQSELAGSPIAPSPGISTYVFAGALCDWDFMDDREPEPERSLYLHDVSALQLRR